MPVVRRFRGSEVNLGVTRQTERVLTAFEARAVTFMMLMYALERRGPGFVLAFALGCALSSSYGFPAGTWPLTRGIVEPIWTASAIRHWSDLIRQGHGQENTSAPYHLRSRDHRALGRPRWMKPGVIRSGPLVWRHPRFVDHAGI
jgi:hypothetical protein